MAEVLDNTEESYLYLMVRDPSWLFVYWHIGAEHLLEVSKTDEDKKWVLRLLKLEDATVHDIAIEPESGNWYVPVEPECTYESGIGYFSPDSSYTPFIDGNKVNTPAMGISRVVDDNWKIPEDIFYRLISPYKFNSAFSMAALISKKSEWADLKWPLSPSVSSSDIQKKPRIK
ncbi:MAG: DUF4912 domain-containing protein [Planctomycetota bacterium]|jgi:hypothetical protein